jgi:hypothetical protein
MVGLIFKSFLDVASVPAQTGDGRRIGGHDLAQLFFGGNNRSP